MYECQALEQSELFPVGTGFPATPPHYDATADHGRPRPVRRVDRHRRSAEGSEKSSGCRSPCCRRWWKGGAEGTAVLGRVLPGHWLAERKGEGGEWRWSAGEASSSQMSHVPRQRLDGLESSNQSSKGKGLIGVFVPFGGRRLSSGEDGPCHLTVGIPSFHSKILKNNRVLGWRRGRNMLKRTWPHNYLNHLESKRTSYRLKIQKMYHATSQFLLNSHKEM